MNDDLEIPAFLRREPTTTPAESPQRRSKRIKKIPYPKDGYKCVGMRAPARARHKESLKRKWERKLKRR
jgi:hypothetical protein